MRGRRLLVLGLALLPAGTAQAASVLVTNVNHLPGRVYPLSLAPNGRIALRPTRYYSAAGNYPLDLAITPNGRQVYVVLNDSPGYVNQFGLSGGGVLSPLSPPTVPTGPPQPSSIVVSPDGLSVYAPESNPCCWIKQWTVRANGTLRPKAPGRVAASGDGDIVMTPDGRYLYLANFSPSGAIQEFAVGAGGRLNPVGSFPTGSFPLGLAITANGRDLYAGLDSSPQQSVEQFTIGGGGALITKSPAMVNLPANTYPQSLTTSPNGRNLYVGDYSGGNGIIQFSILSNGTLKPMTPAEVGTQDVNQLQLSPDGHNLFATAQLGSGNTARYAVSSTGALTETSNVAATGPGSAGIVVTPDQGPIAAFKASSSPVDFATRFNARSSHDPDGTIVSYAWSFGDGKHLVTSTPTASHVYRHRGHYRVTLTVTDNAGASTAVVFTGHQVLLDGTPAARVRHMVTVSP